MSCFVNNTRFLKCKNLVYKNLVYKNFEAEILTKIENIIKILVSLKSLMY